MGPNSHQDLRILWAKVHRTFFIERRRNRSGNISFPVLDILSRSWDIREQNRRLYKIDRNFACFWSQIFLGGGPPPEFLDLDYKIQTVSDHVAKFHGNRPRDLAERVAKEKNITSILLDLPCYRNGRPNKESISQSSNESIDWATNRTTGLPHVHA